MVEWNPYGTRRRHGPGINQKWARGNTVKVGFLSLVVIDKIPTPGDGLPDYYVLASADSTRTYKFTPYIGLERLD